MASIEIKGILRDPMAVLATNTPIRVTTLVGVGETLQSAQATYSTNSAGDYEFDLVYGYHRLEVRFDDKFVKLGDVTINGDLTGPLEISELLMLSVPVTPPIIEEMNRILGEAKQAASDAEDAATRAEDAALLVGGALIDKGDFDASSGDFPPVTVNADWYNISVAGTLSNSDPDQPDIVVAVDDMIYYSLINTRWYKVGVQGGSGTGDMTKAVYDPTGKNDDAFDMDNMDEGVTAKILTQSERDAIEANTTKRSYPEADEQKLAGIGEGANLSDVTAGNNISIDKTDPQNPIISTDSNLVDVIAGDNISINKDDPRNPVISSTASGSGDMEKSTYDPQNISSDSFARSNHTGEQAVSTISGLQTELDSKYSGTNKPNVDDVNGLIDALSGKEDGLGNPTEDGQILSSTTTGVRSWINPPEDTLKKVVIFMATGNGETPALITVPEGYEWGDFEEIHINGGYLGNDAMFNTVVVDNNFIASRGINWSARVRFSSGSAFSATLTGATATTATTSYEGSGALTSVIGYVKRYATRNLSETVQLTASNTTGGTFTADGKVQVNQRYELDIATVLGSEFVGRTLLVRAEIYNDTGTGVADWGETGWFSDNGDRQGTVGKQLKLTEKIVVQTGSTAVCGTSIDSGNPFGNSSTLADALCQIVVQKIDQYVTVTSGN